MKVSWSQRLDRRQAWDWPGGTLVKVRGVPEPQLARDSVGGPSNTIPGTATRVDKAWLAGSVMVLPNAVALPAISCSPPAIGGCSSLLL